MNLVEVSTEADVARLTLNRPDARNALSIELCDALTDRLQAIDSDASLRAVVIAGAGKVFCSGADFTAVSGSAPVDFLEAFERMLETLARHRLPTIAAIQGAALGGGLQLATVCDFRVAARDARLGIPSSKLGIVVNLENVRRLVILVGVARAKEVLMTGRTYSGQEAESAGLVTHAVDPDAVADEALRLADEIGQLAPLAVQGVKRAMQLVLDRTAPVRDETPEQAGAIDELVAQAYASEDLREGLRAASEKRAPRFTGR